MSIWLGSGFSYLVKHSLVVAVKVFEDVINIYSWLQVKWITLHGVFDPHPVRHEEQYWAFHRGPIQPQDWNLKTGQSVRSRIMTTKSTISGISNLLTGPPTWDSLASFWSLQWKFHFLTFSVSGSCFASLTREPLLHFPSQLCVIL